MSVVFSDGFAVGADVAINAYPAVADYAYNAGSGTNLTVNATRDRVEALVANVNLVARIINAAAPTGDQQISATVGMNIAGNARGGLAVRCATAGTANFYLGLLDAAGGANGVIRIYRCDTGSFVLLVTSGIITFTTGAHSLLMSAVGTGATVDLTLTYDTVNTITYSDTHANRKTSGPPGLTIWCSNTAISDAYVDDVVVDGLVAAAILSKPKVIQQAVQRAAYW